MGFAEDKLAYLEKVNAANNSAPTAVNMTETSTSAERSSGDDGYSDPDIEHSIKDFYDNKRMAFFDTRLYRNLFLYNVGGQGQNGKQTFYPHFDYGSYIADLHETPTEVQQQIEEYKSNGEGNYDPKVIEALEKRKKYIDDFMRKNYREYMTARSMIHPYALVKLAGASGSADAVGQFLTYDQYNKRRFYEVDGEQQYSGHYSKTPTTTTLIRWGNESPRGRTPYSFQDFVFCKWWNKIENNRLITLRRYAAPVTDNIEFRDYVIEPITPNNTTESVAFETVDQSGKVQTYQGRNSDDPWTPLATAVTYFGEETGNKLSDLLTFSANYRWKEKIAEDDPIDISSKQNDMGSGLINNTSLGGLGGALSSGLSMTAAIMGFFGEVNNPGSTINLDAVHNIPPDPYKKGPYENRILGPVNVIRNTMRRERGLEFKQDGLKVTFEYVARPIAGINNKAVLLDLLSNMLVLTYSSGTWFGGMWRYNCTDPAVYPWKYGDSMNKLHRGQLFGKDGFTQSITKNIFRDGVGYLAMFLPDAANFIAGLFKGAVNSITSILKGEKPSLNAEFEGALQTGTSRAIQKVIAAKALKGTTVPYIEDQRALLTGEPVGDWHLTIGNPLNPIAMIGNLIVKDVKIEFSDELGPDDFPIGFKAIVTLDHGLGRDRDAIESMFNRGFGRIYTLSKEFRSSADGETKVDKYTGGVNSTEGRVHYDETRNTYYGGGTRFIANIQHTTLANTGTLYNGGTMNYASLKPTNALSLKTTHEVSSYYVNAWQMGYTL